MTKHHRTNETKINLAKLPSGSRVCPIPKNARKILNVGVLIADPKKRSLTFLDNLLMIRITATDAAKVTSKLIQVSLSNGSKTFSNDVYKSPGGT